MSSYISLYETQCSLYSPRFLAFSHVYGNRLSEPRKIISGVIQGSCIGPLLLLLYINSLAKIFDSNTTCVLFADDVKLYTLIKCRYDFVNLQSSLDRILDWSNEHELPISAKSAPALHWVI